MLLHMGHVHIHEALHGVLYPEAHDNGLQKKNMPVEIKVERHKLNSLTEKESNDPKYQGTFNTHFNRLILSLSFKEPYNNIFYPTYILNLTGVEYVATSRCRPRLRRQPGGV